MLDFDDDDFNDNDGGIWSRFWNKEFDGEPLWYIAAMATVPLCFGLLLSQLHAAESVLPWVLGFLITGGTIILWTSLRRHK